MSKNCRIVVTEQCNFDCVYCCQRKPEIRGSFTDETLQQLTKRLELVEYASFAVTGGEPGMCPYFTSKVLGIIRAHSNSPVYLYTNGTAVDTLPSEVLVQFSGINIGVHESNQHSILTCIQTFSSSSLPIRFHINKIYRNEALERVIEAQGHTVKWWTEDQCDTVDEDRVRLL